jgi:type IV pilus assembly protein PilC
MSYGYSLKDADEPTPMAAPARRRSELHSTPRREAVEEVETDDDAGLVLFARRIKKAEIIYVTSQLAIMADTGITLSTALNALAEQEENPSLKTVLNSLKSSVETGEDFSAALARHPKQFDKTYVALVKASEQTGTLAEMLERIANYQRKELDTRNTVRSSLAYPAAMLVIAIGVCVFLLAWVFPKFTPLFDRKGLALPAPTVVMMAISNSLTGYWHFWVAGVIAAIVAFVFGRKTEPGERILDWVKINVPILGPMFRKVILSRSIRTLGTMLASGVPTLEAIRLCGEISGNYYFQQLWFHVVDRVTEGKQICDALSEKQMLPPTLVQMIATGEETGKLDAVLTRVSGYYDHEVENTVKAATSLIEPILITFMGIMVGGIALALLMPIFTLSRNPG